MSKTNLTPEQIGQILRTVDHTLLAPTAQREAFETLCAEARELRVASVCVPPSRVRMCADILAGDIAVCTVAGFPLGYSTPQSKAHEAQEAIAQGASEIDMVINLNHLKDACLDAVADDIAQVRHATQGCILKVIIETCLLTEDEKIALCKIVSDSGADFIKTSTGFGSGGATFADISLMKQHCGARVQIKAAGGINSLADAWEFLRLGAARLGTSRIAGLVRGTAQAGY